MKGRSVLRTIGLRSGVICLALPRFAAPGLSSLPQAEYVDRDLDEERQADAQHYCYANHPSESREIAGNLAPYHALQRLRQARLALP
jgi:hypothetical protein